MEELTEKQKRSRDNLRPWPKGVSGNPKGRPKGKTLKEYAREFLSMLNDEEKYEFLKSCGADIVWRMAEGNPAQATDITSGGKPIYLSSELLKKYDLSSGTEPNSE